MPDGGDRLHLQLDLIKNSPLSNAEGGVFLCFDMAFAGFNFSIQVTT